MEEATKTARERTRSPGVHVHFTQRPSEKERERLTLPQLLRAYPKWSFPVRRLVIVSQPHVAGRTAPHRVRHQSRMERHKSLSVIVVAVLYLALAFVSVYFQRSAGQRHGQALFACHARPLAFESSPQFSGLSLDFFTEEKAGVLMSRMTSEIENFNS